MPATVVAVGSSRAWLIARKSHLENTDETDIGREETGIENHIHTWVQMTPL
jgi:hypothetical protein